MGYSTDFEGQFNLNKKLDNETKNYLEKFSSTRRMKRNLEPEYGTEGEFFIEGEGFAGQDRSNDIIDYNHPPSTQPGLWCQWVPTEDGLGIQWDGNEKFYEYRAWLIYIIRNFLAPKGYVLNGEVSFQGESASDYGVITIVNNEMV